MYPKTKKPLLGKRVILTVSENLGKEWRNLFEDQGAEVWEIPMTRIEPLPVQKKWRARVLKSDWLVFTSAAAVRAFPAVAGDLRDISRCKIAAVGKSTAQVLRSIGLFPDWVGAGPGSKELLSGWPKKAQGRILHLTGDAGNGDLVKGFRKWVFQQSDWSFIEIALGKKCLIPFFAFYALREQIGWFLLVGQQLSDFERSFRDGVPSPK